MGDETKLVRTGPKQDVTRTSTNNDAGDDVVTNRRQADEHRAEHLRSSVTDSSRKITTKCEPREVRDEQNEHHRITCSEKDVGENDAVRAHS